MALALAFGIGIGVIFARFADLVFSILTVLHSRQVRVGPDS